MEQVLELLEAQFASAKDRPAEWRYWQQKAGNEIANQLYQEGHYLEALEVYRGLARLDSSPAWQMPVQYQIGLVYERLEQPSKAVEAYDGVLLHASELKGRPVTPSQSEVVEMARWRKDFLQWNRTARVSSMNLQSRTGVPPLASPNPPDP